MAQNAEASTSRLPRSIATRRKSQDALKNTPNLTSPSSATFSTFTTKGGGTVRSVRTVPPGAAFEPPTPPTPESELAPAGPSHSRQPTAGTSSTAGTGTAKRRRAPRVRYESDSSDGSGDAETSDEEAPWWTFTHRGMAKMRARTMRGGEEGVPGMSGVSGAESGKESIKGLGRRRASRQNSKEKDKKGTPASSIRNVKRPDTSTMRQKSFPTQSALLWRRSFGKENPAAPISLNISAIPPPMLRSSSAPSSPLPPCEPGSPGMTTMVGSSEGSRLNESVVLASPDPAVKADRGDHRPKRQLTAPAFPRFLKRNEQDVHTDTETMGAMAPRAKQREKQRSHGPGPESSSRLSENEGLSEPSRPKASRLQTARLMKISLPEPITQHFAEGWQRGWPHAGTWQDAYYGNYPDHAGMPHDEGHNAQSPGNDAGHTSSRKSSLNQEKRGGGRRKSKGQDRYGTPDHTDRSMPNSPAMDRMEADLAKKKTRRMRSRRYRHAIAPPTPSGLGFKPHDSQRKGGAWDEGHAGEPQGFDWGNDTARNRGRTIEETDELSRSVTRVTMNEKAMAPSDGKRWWWIFSRQKGVQGGREDVGAGKKLRRMLFLDARVTIYIRLINLAFVVTSLALAVRIRLQLEELRVPGLMGSSTTLLIAFSAFTSLHVLTAIYREYFGRPIGLWGLRSKMLWVCLDLAFIALWSSCSSLAINDHIATPLQCTDGVAWWRSGLAEQYARLLQTLQIAQKASDASVSDNITSVEMITHSLGIVLPVEITGSALAHEICNKQIGSIVLALITLLLYTGNMVLSLFRIFETVRRTAHVDRAVMV